MVKLKENKINEDQQLFLEFIETLENDLLNGVITEKQFTQKAKEYRKNNNI